MSRIQQRFADLARQGRKALIPYLTAGDPNPQTSLALMHALVKQGADIIELGFPFSDPSADGPVVQRAVERALAKGTTLRQVLDLVQRFRATDTGTPVVLMGYLNPVEFMGYRKFVEAAVAAGVDGVLIVDMPPEEAHELHQVLRGAGIDTIFLVAPTTSEARMDVICGEGSGYVYYVSLKGVTGASHLDIASVADNLARLRRHTSLPVGVGFGISDPESAARVAVLADAVIVGSALVRRIAELRDGVNYDERQLLKQTDIIAGMRKAMDAATSSQSRSK